MDRFKYKIYVYILVDLGTLFIYHLSIDSRTLFKMYYELCSGLALLVNNYLSSTSDLQPSTAISNQLPDQSVFTRTRTIY